MAARNIPTARRARLGTELRRLRERAGLTASEGGRMLSISHSQLSNIEASRFGVSPERLHAMARNYRCTDAAYLDALVAMATERKGGWWETFREVLPARLLDLAEIEHHGHKLWSVNTVHIPGLLQTADHAREIFRQTVPGFSRSEVEHRINFRLQRQSLLDRDPSTPFRVIVHEAALRIPVGGRSTAQRQLEFLLEHSEREHITLQTIPFSVGAYPASGQSILYVDGPVPQLDTVSLDQSHGPALVHAEAELATYRLVLERMESVALDPDASRTFIHKLAREL
jgi:transcriptional regulator with XRE-family HTH domain